MQERNLAHLFRNRSQTYADAVRWRTRRKGQWISATGAQNQEQVYAIMAGLYELGARKGDPIGILGNTSAEWLQTDWANWCLGAVTVTIYPSLLADTIAFISNDSKMRYLFVENREQYDKVASVRAEMSTVERVIVYDATDMPSDDWVMTFDELRGLHKGSKAEREALATKLAGEISGDDLATIVYTSGTTGNPKGAMLTHTCFLAQCEAVRDRMPQLKAGDVDLMFLPAAHIFGRAQHVVAVDNGLSTAITESVKTVIDDVKDVRPHFFFSVPRIYEKIFSTAKARAESKPATAKIFNWAIGVGREMSRVKERKGQPGLVLKAKNAVADKLIFSKIRNLLGGNIKFAITGGAPLDLEILEFFNAAGVLLLEGWGLTETTAGATINSPTDYRMGSVGRPIKGCEVRLAEDGEIQLRGPMVLKGYYNSPEKTAEAIQDGWFLTGDIGTIDADGFIKIVDRKKDLLITSAGKNVAPQAIEAAFKNSPYISQCAVYGDRKPYLVALLTLDREALAMWAEREGVELGADAHQHPRVKELIAQEAKAANASLASFEQVKYYDILPEDFSVENGLLTPTLKVRRRHIYDQFKPVYEGLYQEKN
ncbi:MAG TPA: long-chain fatty acid--CoA ligase [Herpetosiphonaceae bacterium]|nr:long-chain fatty acid--CoA ligase [Herpetosiphonaceae bacterium]